MELPQKKTGSGRMNTVRGLVVASFAGARKSEDLGPSWEHHLWHKMC